MLDQKIPTIALDSDSDEGDSDEEGNIGDGDGGRRRVAPTATAGSTGPSRTKAVEDIHPDLAIYYRGKQAAEIRRRAKEQEEEDRKKRAAREEAWRQRQAERRSKSSSAVVVLSDSDAGKGGAKAGPDSGPICIDDSGTDEDEEKDSGARAGARGTSDNGAQAVAASPPNDADNSADAADAADETPRIALTLRAASGQSMPVKIKTTTVWRKVLDAFLANVDGDVAAGKGSKAQLLWDGEVIDLQSTAGDLEGLEDDELIDVKW